jgi:two-component sensor histidine kinase/DNA-binding response OmpR family regulator
VKKAGLPEKVSVLLVDDSPEKLLSLESILSRDTFKIEKANSGMDALRLLLRDDFALILLDVNMPLMDGYETATLIRSRRKSEYTPIIFITAFSMDEKEMARGYALGAVDYIFAPIVPAILSAKVRFFVELHRMNRRVNSQADALRIQAENLIAANAKLERTTRELRQEVEMRKRTEAELTESRIRLNHSNEMLEAKVKERTAELETLNQSLLKEIRDRTAAEQELKESLEEKQALLKEIHHRVKNNLQIISSLLRLQSTKVTDKGSAELLLDSQNRIKSMALVHEQLYGSSDLSRIGFARYLKDMTDQLLRAFDAAGKGIELKLDVQDIPMSVDMAVPCGLIVHELISNALKHAFPPGRPTADSLRPTVLLRFQCMGAGDCEILVRDNGIGLPPEEVLKQSRSLGMQLVKTLVKQIKGGLRVERKDGTSFHILMAPENERKKEHG